MLNTVKSKPFFPLNLNTKPISGVSGLKGKKFNSILDLEKYLIKIFGDGELVHLFYYEDEQDLEHPEIGNYMNEKISYNLFNLRNGISVQIEILERKGFIILDFL